MFSIANFEYLIAGVEPSFIGYQPDKKISKSTIKTLKNRCNWFKVSNTDAIKTLPKFVFLACIVNFEQISQITLLHLESTLNKRFMTSQKISFLAVN